MPPWTLVTGSALTLLAGVLYGLAGVRFARRARTTAPTRDAAHALRLFSLFWFGVAFFGLTDGAWSLAVPLLDPPLAVGVTILHLKTLAGCVGFLGLVYYLTYLYWGSRRALVPLAALYGFVYAVATYSYVVAHPVGQEAQTWRSGLTYDNGGTFAGTLGTVALFLPPLVASLAYAGLLRHADDPRQRRRVLAVSATLAVFFGGLLVGWLVKGIPWWPLAEKLLAIATVLLLLAVHARDPSPSDAETDGPAAARGV